jgi:hypothetical protein
VSYHRVEQGEHLSSIASKWGFIDFRTIWDHPENATLKSKRQNPNVLLPGDQLFIPDKQEKEIQAGTEKRHSFTVDTQKLELRLVLEELYLGPIANTKCELNVENNTIQLTSDDQGRIEQEIPSTAANAFLIVKDRNSPLNDIVVDIKIGHLDPVDSLSGQKARLNNLGYFAGDMAVNDEAMFKSAVEEFQCDHPPLKVDGLCGPKTQAKLKEVHGC